MADYSKRKNAELEELLKARGLPHTGKKAELVARLQQNDAETAAAEAVATEAPAAADAAGAPEDEIDWDDEAAGATSQPAAAAIAAGGVGRVANPEAVPNQVKGEDTSNTDGLKVSEPAAEGVDAAAGDAKPAEEEEAKPKKDFSAHLEVSSLEAELAKRKARAARFGIPEADAQDATKALERAKRFGTGGAEGGEDAGAGGVAAAEEGVKGLDFALPERERKRGRGDREQGGRDGKRRDSRRRDGRGQGGGGGRNDDQRGKDRAAADARKKRFGGGGGGGGGSSEQSDKDRLAAEARKKRFAAQTA